MTLWQILIVIAIVVIPLAAAVAVTIWTVPRPGSRPPREQRPAQPNEAGVGVIESAPRRAGESTPDQR